jgi:CRISPR/Cas system-associated endonuclease Cas1
MQSQLTSLSSKFEAFLKSGSSNKNETKSTKSTKGGSEADKAAKKSKDHKSRLLRLSSPDGKKAQQKFLEQEGKLACAYFNMKNGCNSNKCKFSHHCPITGRMGKTAMEADE